MLDRHPDLTSEVIFGLGWIYALLFTMNIWWTFRSLKRDGHLRIGSQRVPVGAFWALYCGVLAMISIAHLIGSGSPERFPMRLPLVFKDFLDIILGDPVSYFAILVIAFGIMIRFRRWLVKPTVAWILLNISLVFMALSLTDYDFRQIVGKPDNVPIVSMLFILAFLNWVYFSKAVENDDRLAAGRPLLGEEDNDKVLVWPDLVYTELICMVILTVVLVAWGMVLQAPLEEPANAAKTPNPSKAPWYFLGLQEMLVYYDPWLAGVVFPSLILVGLMALPYIDFNKKGNGYFCFNDRKFAITVFQFGFFPLWVAMIVLGTFLRGPNWGFFGIYEYWDVHKLQVLNNVFLSDWFWNEILGRGVPMAPADASGPAKVLWILVRESPGFILILIYFFVLPPVMAATVLRKFYERMGFIRFMVFSNLLLFMAALPIKMVLRWSVNLKYLVTIPEWFFNI